MHQHRVEQRRDPFSRLGEPLRPLRRDQDVADRGEHERTRIDFPRRSDQRQELPRKLASAEREMFGDDDIRRKPGGERDQLLAARGKPLGRGRNAILIEQVAEIRALRAHRRQLLEAIARCTLAVRHAAAGERDLVPHSGQGLRQLSRPYQMADPEQMRDRDQDARAHGAPSLPATAASSAR